MIRLTALGLLLNFLGTLILWQFGWPQPSFKEPSRHVLLALEEDNEGYEAGMAQLKKVRERHKTWSLLGALFVALGFALQGLGLLF